MKNMKTKTFKIGEFTLGGIIKVEITGKVIVIKALDWNSKVEVSTGSVLTTDYSAENKIDKYLNELTSSYYAGKVMEYIKSNVTFLYL